MSLDSTKSILRKLDFPLCVKEALSRIEQLCISNVMPNAERLHNFKQTDLAMELISEFVFCETDRRGGRKNRLTYIQEMQLLEVLGDYFDFCHNSALGGDASRNTVFMSLFPHTYVERCQFLVKLVSFSICTNNIPLLSATGVLMQQVGCTSNFSVELAKGLINDFFVLLPETICKLKELPSKAPLFTANLLTAITEIYFRPENTYDPLIPSNPLLNVLGDWLCNSESLCYTALTSNLLHCLPSGGIPMQPVTPFVGILRWCVLAPLYDKGDCDTYSKIHLSTLQSLLVAQIYCPVPNQRNVVSAQDLCILIKSCSNRIQQSANLVGSKRKQKKEILQHDVKLSLERLSQFVQVALHTNSTYGNKQELIQQLKTLPPTRMIPLILSEHKKII